MRLRPLLLSLALATIAACGGKAGPSTIDNRPTPAAADADPVAALEALVRAIDADDGAALAALGDPPDGITLWYTPGAGYAVYDIVKPDDPTPPSKQIGNRDTVASEYWGSNYWPTIARSIRDGLGRLDRDPANPNDAIYGTCADEEQQDLRAYLSRGNSDENLHSMDLGGDGEVPPERIRRELVRFHTWGFSAYLAERDGRWRIVHLVVTDPCSA